MLKLSQGIRGTPAEHKLAYTEALLSLRDYIDGVSGSPFLRDVYEAASIELGQVAAAVGMIEELGELSTALLEIPRHSPRVDPELVAKYKADVRDALGDLRIYQLDFAARNQIDLEAAVNATWAKVAQRDWVKNKQDGGEKA